MFNNVFLSRNYNQRYFERQWLPRVTAKRTWRRWTMCHHESEEDHRSNRTRWVRSKSQVFETQECQTFKGLHVMMMRHCRCFHFISSAISSRGRTVTRRQTITIAVSSNAFLFRETRRSPKRRKQGDRPVGRRDRRTKRTKYGDLFGLQSHVFCIH